MKKLNILKTIVDIFLVISIPTILIIVFFIPFLFIIDDFDFIPIRVNSIDIIAENVASKILLTTVLLSYLILFYCVFLFKKILRDFQILKMFNDNVLSRLNKIGYLLIFCSFLNGVPSFLYRLLYKQKFSVDFGFSPFLLFLCLGLFFMILSEIFKISKTMKEENDLTV